LKIQTAKILVLMVVSRIFGILLKPIVVMIPQHDFTLMICSPITQIHKNIGGQQAIVSKVENQLNVATCSRIRKISKNSLTFSHLRNSISSSIWGFSLRMPSIS
jgi:hypothetical protein